MFWLTFAEMARVVAPGGFIYISAPSNGPYHGHPGDCWRFYSDAPKALAQWATHCGHELELVEAFMMPPISDVWVDCVAVFGKPPVPRRGRIIHQFPAAHKVSPEAFSGDRHHHSPRSDMDYQT
jgi:hypothetical protein